MPDSVYKIVMLPNGDIALQRADHTEEPVVTISFSEQANKYLQEARLDIARVMIDAGIEAAQQFSFDEAFELMESDVDLMDPSRVLH
ncbi:MAG: hypothetical protein R3E73_09455 [Porticoccaceae bacterium]|nr:hypothetical protein [Pseudomonadales bacterium]MCP5171537.1 hypothetical protein [Pseudomonadales bacterium]